MKDILPQRLRTSIGYVLHRSGLIRLCWCISRRARRVQLFLVRGSLKPYNCLMTTIVVGQEEFAHQFADIAYSENRTVHNLGRFFSWQIDPAGFSQVDITLISAGSDWHRALTGGHALLPWVNFSVPLYRPMADLKERFSRRRRRDAQKIKHRAYSYMVSHGDIRDFDYFYHRLYCPYVAWRFGKAAFVERYSDLRARYEGKGGIVWVCRREQPIAGLAFQVRGETVYALALGANLNCASSERNLAGQASLLFLIDWGKRNGLKRLGYGATPPFLQNGLFQYKKEWGMTAEAKAGPPFCSLRIENVNEASLSFLQQNPFVTFDGGKTAGVIFVSHKLTVEELKQWSSRYLIPGIDSLTLVSFFEKSAGRQDATSSPTEARDSKALPGLILTICQSLRRKGFDTEVIEQQGI